MCEHKTLIKEQNSVKELKVTWLLCLHAVNTLCCELLHCNNRLHNVIYCEIKLQSVFRLVMHKKHS